MSQLRDRVIRGAIRKSARFIELRWHERDFFYGLLNWADDYGRFEADAEVLRGGIYHPRDMRKVTARSVQEALLRCRELGLVRLYSVGGKGYGRILNFNQRMKFPRSEHPNEPDAEPELALGLEGAAMQGEAVPQVQALGAESREVFEPKVSAKRVARNRSPERVRRELLAEKGEVERELREILRPGGAAYNVRPTGEKRVRYDALFARREELLRELKKLDALKREEGGA